MSSSAQTPAHFRRPLTLRWISASVLGAAWATTMSAADIVFPADAGQASVATFGAIPNDGIDDTAAIQSAIDTTFPINDGGNPANNRTLYLPAGTYDVSGTLTWQRWVNFRGAGPGRTIIRLKNNAAGFGGGANKPVLHAYFDQNRSFANYIEGLTVDVGSGNAGAIGIKWNNHNEGALRDVVIKSSDGQGAIGLDQTENEFGPALVKNLTVDGFAKGIVTVGSVSHCTYYNLTLKNQTVVGFENNLPVSIYNLISTNSVPAIQNNNFYLAHLVLVKATLNGGSAGASAIVNLNAGGLYLRDVTTAGYARALVDGGVNQSGITITERLSDELPTAFTGSRTTHLGLPIEDAPEGVIEPLTSWVKPAGGSTAQIQAAFDSGAATVYLNFAQSYEVLSTIVIPATVRRVVGMRGNGISSSYGSYQDHLPVDQPVVRVVGVTTEPLVLEGLNFTRWPYNPTRPGIEVASNRPVVMRSCGGGQVILPTGYSGKVWMEDTHCDLRINGQQQVWAAHYNEENNPDGVVPNREYVINAGGSFWCLGMKTESFATHIITTSGGKSELIGGFFRDHDVPTGDNQPFFRTTDSQLTATYLEYDWGGGHDRGLHAVETRAGVTHELRLPRSNHRIGLYAAAPVLLPPEPPVMIAPTITSVAPENATVGVAYNHVSSATGSTPMTWSISAGTLPTGLSLSVSTGAITGTPTVVGTVTGTLTASNGTGAPANQPFAVTVSGTPPPPVTPNPDPVADSGSSSGTCGSGTQSSLLIGALAMMSLLHRRRARTVN